MRLTGRQETEGAMAGSGSWNPWRVTAIVMAFVMLTALVTGLVVANWAGPQAPAPPRPTRPFSTPPGGPVGTPPHRAAQPAIPPQSAVAECNGVAALQTGPGERTMKVVRDPGGGMEAGKGTAIGVGVSAGTLYGLNENRKQDQRYRDAYAACMRARGYPS
jgi:hypothetical protein